MRELGWVEGQNLLVEWHFAEGHLDRLPALMAEVGLVNIRQEPAQFKLREPRDMRMVGEKTRASLGAA